MTDESREAARAACQELRGLTRRMCIMASSDPEFSQALIERQLSEMRTVMDQIRVAVLHEIRLPDGVCRACGRQVNSIAGVSVHHCGPYQWAERTNTLLWLLLEELKAAVRKPPKEKQ